MIRSSDASSVCSEGAEGVAICGMHLRPSFCEDFKGPSRTGRSWSPLVSETGPGGPGKRRACGTDPRVLGSPHPREVQPASSCVVAGDGWATVRTCLTCQVCI